MGNKLSLHCLSLLVNKYIGKEIYNQVDKETKIILIADAMNQFQLEMIQRFGSLRNYAKDWMKRNGFENEKEYIKYLAYTKGVKTNNEYQRECAKEAGFKSRYDRINKKAQSQGYHSYHHLKLERLKNRGFNSERKYREYLLEREGNNLKTYSQLLKKNKLIKEGKDFIIDKGYVKEIKKEIRVGQYQISKLKFMEKYGENITPLSS